MNRASRSSPRALAVGSHRSSFGRSTSVGGAAIYRFTRQVCWQDTPDALLPPALQEANPLNLRRMIDGKIS